MDHESLTLISEMRTKLDTLEARLRAEEVSETPAVPPNGKGVYNLFGEESDEEEQEKTPEPEEEGFIELQDDAIDLIDQDNSQPAPDLRKFRRQREINESISNNILQSIGAASPEVGATAKQVSKEIGVPAYKIEKLMRDLCKQDKIETVQLRPKTYRLTT